MKAEGAALTGVSAQSFWIGGILVTDRLPGLTRCQLLLKPALQTGKPPTDLKPARAKLLTP